MINREQCGQFIDANTDNMVKDWKRLVEIETGSFDKEGLEEIHLRQCLRASGLGVT